MCRHVGFKFNFYFSMTMLHMRIASHDDAAHATHMRCTYACHAYPYVDAEGRCAPHANLCAAIACACAARVNDGDAHEHGASHGASHDGAAHVH